MLRKVFSLWLLISLVMANPLWAANVAKPYTFAPNTPIYSSPMNANFDTLYNEFNGNIDNSNISPSAAIDSTKLDLTGPVFGYTEKVLADSPVTLTVSSPMVQYSNTTGGAVTFNLPLASTAAGKVFFFGKRGDPSVTIQRQGSDNIINNSGQTATTITLSNIKARSVLVCDGTRWLELQHVDFGNNFNHSQVINIFEQGIDTSATPAIFDTYASVRIADTSSNSITYTLPLASACNNKYFFFKKEHAANTVTIQRGGSDTIDGETSIVLSDQYEWLWVKADSTNGVWHIMGRSQAASNSAQNAIFQARLTLETGVPVSTSDQSSKSTLYLTAYNGNQIGQWNGTSTDIKTIQGGEVSLSLSGLTDNLPADVFCEDTDADGDIDALTLTNWSSASARATALALVADGYYVKTGDTSKRFCGTILPDSTTTTSDTTAHRGVSNFYNRVLRPVRAADTTDSWTYTTTSNRSFNNSTTNGVGAVEFVVCHSDVVADLIARMNLQITGTTSLVSSSVGIGIDSTSTNSAPVFDNIGSSGDNPADRSLISGSAKYHGFPGIGRHLAYPLEYGSTNLTFYGDNGGLCQSGLFGNLLM